MISAIIPVHNVDKYLPMCLDSILKQTYTDYEVIVVDDGASDNSGTICDDYAAKDNRIKVLHLKNGGVSKARNAGLYAARGEFVTFIDSDDYIEPYTFQTYLNTLRKNNADLVKVGYFKEYDDGTQVKVMVENEYCFSNTWEFHYCLEKNEYYSFVWSMCIRRECIGEVKFDENINWLEDHIFAYQCYFNCKRMVVSNRVCYHYMVRERNDRLSYVNNPWVINKASQSVLQLKTRLNASHYKEMDEYAQKEYMFNLHLMIQILYNGNYTYKERKSLSKTPLYKIKRPFKEEKIYFSKCVPFIFKDIILLLLFSFRKLPKQNK